MYQKKGWTDQEDKIIRNAVKPMGDRPRWKSIATQINQLRQNIDWPNRRTPKQCRQRWHNKLDPQILDKEWDQNEINKLFNLHHEYGNKWSLIATMMHGRTDNCVKNMFYSALRKGMRKLNKYIVNLKRKLSQNKNICIKEFKDVVLTKLIAVADKNYDDKLDVRENSRSKTEKLSQAIKLTLVLVSKNEDDYFGHVKNGVPDDEYTLEENLFKNIQQFCRNCKRKKGKRKNDQDEQNEVVSQMSEESKQVEKNQAKNRPELNIQPTQKSKKISMNLPSHEIKNSNSKEMNFQSEKSYQNHGIITLKDLKDHEISSNLEFFSLNYMNNFTSGNLEQTKQKTLDNLKSGLQKFHPKQKNENFEFQNNKNLEQKPEFSFFSNIRSVDFQQTDRYGKLSKDFKPQQIFKHGNPSQQPLEASQNQFSLTSSNQFSPIDKSHSFFNFFRCDENQHDMNQGIYNSSSFQSSSNKQHEKLMELINRKSEEKEDIKASQVFSQIFTLPKVYTFMNFSRGNLKKQI